jgi:membrane protein YdbS with pleckstrin-like domain
VTEPDADALPPEPDRRLEPSVLIGWIGTGIVMWVVAVLALGALASVLDEIDGMPGWVAPVLRIGSWVFGFVATAVAPALRYRAWRFAIREDEIDIRHGVFVMRRTIVPMARVQHVDTERSFLGQALDLATLKIHTAAGTHEIPGLHVGTADVLRTRIATHARVPDVV